MWTGRAIDVDLAAQNLRVRTGPEVLVFDPPPPPPPPPGDAFVPPDPLTGTDDVKVTRLSTFPHAFLIEFQGGAGLQAQPLLVPNGSTLRDNTTGGEPATTPLPVLGASESGTTATLALAAGHPIKVGASITVAGVGTGYNGTFIVTATTTTSVSYTTTAGLSTLGAAGTVSKVVNVEIVQVGDATHNCIQHLELPTLDMGALGYFKLTYAGQQTGAIQVSTNSDGLSAGRIAIMLGALPNLFSLDNTAALNAFFVSVPSGTAAAHTLVRFPAGKSYRCDFEVDVLSKSYLDIDLNGTMTQDGSAWNGTTGELKFAYPTIYAIASIAGFSSNGTGGRKQLNFSGHAHVSVFNGKIEGAGNGTAYHRDCEQEHNLNVRTGVGFHAHHLELRGAMGDCFQWAGATDTEFTDDIEIDHCTVAQWARVWTSSQGNGRNVWAHHLYPVGPVGRSFVDLEQVNGLLEIRNFAYTDTIDRVLKYDGSEPLNWMAFGGSGKIFGVTIARCQTRKVRIGSGTPNAQFFKLTTNGVGTFRLVAFDERQDFGYSGFASGGSFKFTCGGFESTTAVAWNANLDVVRAAVDQATKEAIAAYLGLPTSSVVTERDNWGTTGGRLYLKTPTLTDIPQLTITSIVGPMTVTYERTFVSGGETTAPLSAVNATAADVNAAMLALYKYPTNLEQSDVIVTGGPLPAPIFLDLGTPHLDTEVPMLGKVELGGCQLTIFKGARFDYTIEDVEGVVATDGGICQFTGSDIVRFRRVSQAWSGSGHLSVQYTQCSHVGAEINAEDGLPYQRDNVSTPPGGWA